MDPHGRTRYQDRRDGSNGIMSNMVSYNMTGIIMIEGTLDEATYDFDMEWPELEAEPNDMDALRYMMDAGILQIIHKDTELVEEA